MTTTTPPPQYTDAGRAPRKERTGLVYALIRRIHLYSALILAVFITMYFVTGIAIVHQGWFGKETPPVETTTTHTLDPDLRPTDADFAPRLAERLDLPGRYSEVQPRGENRWFITYFRPGLYHEVTIEPDRTARVMRRDLALRQTLVGFHRLHGYHGNWFFILWAAMMDLVNVAMVVFGLTGIYMWWKLSKRHALGWLLLLASYGYTATIIAYLYFGR